MRPVIYEEKPKNAQSLRRLPVRMTLIDRWCALSGGPMICWQGDSTAASSRRAPDDPILDGGKMRQRCWFARILVSVVGAVAGKLNGVSAYHGK
jgi:hypothetical protein